MDGAKYVNTTVNNRANDVIIVIISIIIIIIIIIVNRADTSGPEACNPVFMKH
jgi:hypothetical protein